MPKIERCCQRDKKFELIVLFSDIFPRVVENPSLYIATLSHLHNIEKISKFVQNIFPKLTES